MIKIGNVMNKKEAKSYVGQYLRYYNTVFRVMAYEGSFSSFGNTWIISHDGGITTRYLTEREIWLDSSFLIGDMTLAIYG